MFTLIKEATARWFPSNLLGHWPVCL